jgi:polysaccharide export outer membrane protein
MATGCHAIDFYTPTLQKAVPPELEPPRELRMVSLPAYRIEPPDIIRIEVVKLVPRNSYRLGPGDVLMIKCLGTMPKHPINQYYRVEDDGNLILGPPYGMIRAQGLTVLEVQADLLRLLSTTLNNPQVSVELARSATVEQFTGPYQVFNDGTINLHKCGMVYVSGKTVTEARAAVQARLAQYFDAPDVGVDVMQYNSKSYYVITETRVGNGTLWRFPITGNETVLDAIAQMERTAPMSSKTIWISRRAPTSVGREQILPVDWDAIAHSAITDTNYQIMPGDRVYVVDDGAVAANYVLNKLVSPLERLFGITSLGVSSVIDAEALGRNYNKDRLN